MKIHVPLIYANLHKIPSNTYLDIYPLQGISQVSFRITASSLFIYVQTELHIPVTIMWLCKRLNPIYLSRGTLIQLNFILYSLQSRSFKFIMLIFRMRIRALWLFSATLLSVLIQTICTPNPPIIISIV